MNAFGWQLRSALTVVVALCCGALALLWPQWRDELRAQTYATVTINGGATYTKSTSVTLTLSPTLPTSGISMCISNTTTCTAWTAFASTKSWTLTTGNGTKTVNVWFKDAWGNTTPTPSSASIILDATAPTNGTVVATPGAGQIALNWSGFTDALSGMAGYKVVFATGSAPTSCSTGTVVPGYDGTSTAYTHTGLINATYGYRVCAIDNAGNMSTGATATARPLPAETNPPTGSVVINGGAAYTRSSAVTLTLTATDASLPVQMCISNTSTCTTFSAFASTKSWTLTTGNGTKTVNVWFKDAWGNTTPTPSSASITLDGTAPTNGIVRAIPGNGEISLNWSGFNDAGSGMGGYKVVFATGTVPTSCSAGTAIPGYDGTSTTPIHTGLTNGTTYYYRVCGVDKAGNISTGSVATAKPSGFVQADLTGTWDGLAFSTGLQAGWTSMVFTIDNAGSVTMTSYLDSTGDTTLPPPGSVALFIDATGNVSMGGSSGLPSFDGTMSSDKTLIIGNDSFVVGAFEMSVFRKRAAGVTYNDADMENLSFALHELDSNEVWYHGEGYFDGTGQGTITSYNSPLGALTPPGAVGTLQIDSVGRVAAASDPSIHGIMTIDKKVIFMTGTGDSNTNVLNVILVTGQTFTTADVAGTYSFHALNTGSPSFWSYGTFIADSAGNRSYLSFLASDGSTTLPANDVVFIDGDGTITASANDSYHGRMAFNKNLFVRTATQGTGSYGLLIGIK